MDISMEYTYRVDAAGLGLLHAELDLAFMRAAGRVRDRARLNIGRLGRVDTGAMQQRIETRRSGLMEYTITPTTSYAAYQELGTSDHGPRNARVLTWVPRGGKRVFAHRVRGVTAGRFMRDAIQSLSEADFT